MMTCCFPWAGARARWDLLETASQSRLILREGWLDVVSSREPKQRRKVFARLTPVAMAFYDQEPEAYENTGAAPLRLRPRDAVLLRDLSQLLGRAEGCDHTRLVSTKCDSWEMYSGSPEENREWFDAIEQRLKHFRQAQQSSVGDGLTDNLAAPGEATPSESGGCLQGLARFLPCSIHSGTREDSFSHRVSDHFQPYRGDRDGGLSSLVEMGRVAQVSDPDLQEVQAAHWSEEAVTYLRSNKAVPAELVADFSLTLRFGAPDGLKRLIWPLAAGRGLSLDDAKSFYANLTASAFGSSVPTEFQDPTPTFCQGMRGLDEAPPLDCVVKHLSLLTDAGMIALRRLLWTKQLTSHIEFSPFLSNLFATLLVFFSEAEVMWLVDAILQDAEHDMCAAEKAQNPRIILTKQMLNKQAKLLVREGKRRVNAGEAVAHLERLGLDMHAVAAELLQDGLAHALPFRAFCRLVGSVLCEGSEVILRYALALLKLQTPALLACGSATEARERLQNLGSGLGESPEIIDSMTKTAFSVTLSQRFGRVSSVWGSDFVSPEDGSKMFCRPRLFEPRGKCPDEVWEALWSWVPQTCRILDPRLIYSPQLHGTSLHTCLELAAKHADCPMFFFVFTTTGHILGGFSPQMWTRTHNYMKLVDLIRPAEDAFVFRRDQQEKAVDVFVWSGQNELLLHASEASGLIFGGDEVALSIGSCLSRGGTSPSKSFNSPVLLKSKQEDDSTGDFEVVTFEVFALV